MISLKLRIIREHNRLHTFLSKVLWKLGDKNATKIYLFHDIKDDISEVKSQFAITQQSFEKFVLFQLKRGANPITFEQLSAEIIDDNCNKNGFYISFDDANNTVYTKAYPFLRKHKIPFIIFITRELIGKRGFLTATQIEELANDPLCSVGSHGINHKMFRYFSHNEAATEWRESKKFLEQWLNVPVKCFAFPYGRVVECSPRNVKQLIGINKYDFAFSAIAATLKQSWFTGRFFLPRINVSEEYVNMYTK